MRSDHKLDTMCKRRQISNINHIEQSQINHLNSNELVSQTKTMSNENQILTINIKFLNETQKSILAHPNDTISKIKRFISK